MDNLTFIREAFSKFYNENIDRIEVPKSIGSREFGFTMFREGVMVRHKGFINPEDLKEFIKKNVPSNVYYSAAYYSVPEAKMDEKGWLGSDLFFDIDADHIPTKCDKKHDTWTCRGCGFKGRGEAPEKCPSCSGESFDEKTWLCEVCLETARNETIKLVDMLMDDLGFSPKEIKCSFSGHRGYHVQVESEYILNLDSNARKEIVDYVTGTGIDAVFHGLEEIGDGKTVFLAGPSLNDAGWRGRAARGVYEFLLTATDIDLKKLGLKKKVVERILANRDEILASWKVNGPWNMIEGLGLEGWRKIINYGVTFQSAKIDTVVTSDVHRLIRLPGTLHGKTGLLKISFPISRIEDFDPLREALAFKSGEVEVYVDEAPAFRLGDDVFGPFEKQKAVLPLSAVILLLCKNAARVIDQHV
ncbi:MAG: DNA primase small subunit PriS [Candidatus Bathyarchaeota archaeon]|nr:DNA primase small subunit PriS [Candidatus Bathyarchaeota archaeon]